MANKDERFAKAVKIINDMDPSKFPLLLNRIAQSMQSDIEKNKPFTDDEEEKLQTSLELEKDDLKILIVSISDIIRNAACNMMQPGTFQRHLNEVLKLNEDKTVAFLQVWTNSAKGIVDQLRQKSVYPSKLEDVNWSLNLQIASDVQLKQKIPNAVIQFGLKTDSCGEYVKENVNVTFSHSELFEFYKQLESIQVQLDSLR